MAIIIGNLFPGRVNAGDGNYPNGSFKNETAPAADDGTPLDEIYINDKEGFYQRLLDEAGIVASGAADTILVSQYFNALLALFAGLTTGPNGNVPTLNGVGQLVDSGVSLADLQAAVTFQGNWNATTNTPDIDAVAVEGDYYIVSVAGNTDLDGITDWEVNDWAVKGATAWAKVDNTSSLTADELAGIQNSPTPLTAGNPAASQADLSGFGSGGHFSAEYNGSNVALQSEMWVKVPIDTIIQSHPDFSNSAGVITISAGTYRVIATMSYFEMNGDLSNNIDLRIRVRQTTGGATTVHTGGRNAFDKAVELIIVGSALWGAEFTLAGDEDFELQVFLGNPGSGGGFIGSQDETRTGLTIQKVS